MTYTASPQTAPTDDAENITSKPHGLLALETTPVQQTKTKDSTQRLCVGSSYQNQNFATPFADAENITSKPHGPRALQIAPAQQKERT